MDNNCIKALKTNFLGNSNFENQIKKVDKNNYVKNGFHNACKSKEDSSMQLLLDEAKENYGLFRKNEFLEPPSPTRNGKPPLQTVLINEQSSITPTKTPTKGKCKMDPLTPTTNLKMLATVTEKKTKNIDDLIESNLPNKDSEDPYRNGQSRKDKSLGLLCLRFLSKYPLYPPTSKLIEISLDEVAKDLSVERRRIYDIVNVLESIEMVNRIAKNRYAWHGKKNLINTLIRLKTLAESKNYAHLIQCMHEQELNRQVKELENSQDSSCIPMFLPDNGSFSDRDISLESKREKSLGVMSQKFLMLFLVSKQKTVNLDIAAKILIGDANVEFSENAKLKTKIRRLYDIANILTSVELIRKVHVTETRGRKPAFRYTGPEVEDLNDIQNTPDNRQRSSSKHSLLDQLTSQELSSSPIHFVGNKHKLLNEDIPTSKRLKFPRTKSHEVPRPAIATAKKKLMSRHPSLQEICEVAEKERQRLYYSAPNSPINCIKKKGNVYADSYKELQTGKIYCEHLINQSSKGQLKSTAVSQPPFMVVQGSNQVQLLTVEQSEQISPVIHTADKISSKENPSVPFRLKPAAREQIKSNKDNPSPIPSLSSVLNNACTFITLTGEQFEVLRQSLVPSQNTDNGIKFVDASTQSSPVQNVSLEFSSKDQQTSQIELLNYPMDYPIEIFQNISQNGPKSEVLSELTQMLAAEKYKLIIGQKDVKEIAINLRPTSGLMDRIHNSNKLRPSPRALHLEPEFHNSPSSSLPLKSLPNDDLASPLLDDEQSNIVSPQLLVASHLNSNQTTPHLVNPAAVHGMTKLGVQQRKLFTQQSPINTNSSLSQGSHHSPIPSRCSSSSSNSELESIFTNSDSNGPYLASENANRFSSLTSKTRTPPNTLSQVPIHTTVNQMISGPVFGYQTLQSCNRTADEVLRFAISPITSPANGFYPVIAHPENIFATQLIRVPIANSPMTTLGTSLSTPQALYSIPNQTELLISNASLTPIAQEKTTPKSFFGHTPGTINLTPPTNTIAQTCINTAASPLSNIISRRLSLS